MNSNQNVAMQLALLTLMVSLGCGSSHQPGRVSVDGVVTLDGKPVSEAVVLFEPIAPAEGNRTSAAVVKGKFHLEKSQGPSVGQYRIVVNPMEPDPETMLQRSGKKTPDVVLNYRRLDAAIHRQGTITFDFRANQANVIDVSLKSK